MAQRRSVFALQAMRDLPHPSTIKTSAPSLIGVIERPRLINALAAVPATAKWMQAPSGSGKSTLAASWARNRAKPFAWYRLDERDNDPAFFYGEFADTVRGQLKLSDGLPKFSIDDHDRQQVFARRFFAALAEQVDNSALIVFDDMQRLTADSVLSSLNELFELAEERIELLFVSQTTAPTAFFDAIATRRLALLNDADLRFDLDECKAMATALRIEDAQCEQIAAVTGGHAGALVLACELLRGTDARSALGVETVERIHSHLLAKLIDRIPEPRRELLIQTAFVNQLTRAIAESLAAVEAAKQLDSLVETGLLRRVGAEAAEVFEAHALVRQGMQTLVTSRLGARKARALAERTATALIENDQQEAALALLIEIRSTARAIVVLEQLAKQYAARGHATLLMSAVVKLPQGDVCGNPWLCFWAGQALLAVNEEQARVWLGHAYFAFEKNADAAGLRLAAASVVTAFGLEWGDLRELHVWIDRHREAGGETPIAVGQPFEASLIMGVACAALVSGSYPPQINSDALVNREQQLLESDQAWLSDDQRVQAARLLIDQGYVFARYELAQTVIVATRQLIDRSVGSVLHRGRWLIAAAFAHYLAGDMPRSVSFLNDARLIAQTSHSTRLSFELGLAFANHWMRARDLPRAAEELQELEIVASSAPPAQRAEHARLMARLLLLQGRLVEGLKWAQEAKRLAVPAGFTGASLRAFEIELVYALAANARLSEAIDLVSSLEVEPREARLAIEHCLRFLNSGKSDLNSLRLGLQNAAQIQFIHLLERAHGPLVEVCDAALANNVETEFVHQLIAAKQLPPPPLAGPHWPWPAKVRTLGGFRLEIQGERYRPTHKAQEKPLELLKLFLTCQAMGRDSAEKSWISERLWPDADSEKARKSLDMTVARLRRLLGSDETILLNEGRLQLSPLQVWTDIRPLRRALSHARAQRDDYITHKPHEEAALSLAAVLEHYTGPFLAEEEGPAWLLAGREAISAAVRQALLSADALFDGSADERLVPALERAVAVDPTSEDLARSLMRAHLRLGHQGEAIRVYRRLREMLSLLLSIAPSKDTEYLREKAYATESQKIA